MLGWKPVSSEAEKQPVDLPLWLETQQESISPASQAKNTEKLQVPLHSFLYVSLSVFLASPYSISNSCQLVGSAPWSKVDFINSLGIHTVIKYPSALRTQPVGSSSAVCRNCRTEIFNVQLMSGETEFQWEHALQFGQSIIGSDFMLSLKEHIARVIDISTCLSMQSPMLLGPQLCRTNGSSDSHSGLAAVTAVGCGPGSVL